MSDPIRMVYVSLFSIILALSTLIFYRFVYPKKRINPIFIVLALSIPPIVSIFREGTYESGDLSLHAMRTFSYFNILFKEHIFLPHWTPEFNAGYGDPYFLFSYQLPYIAGSILHFLGFSIINSLKIILIGSYIFSGLFMFLWIREELDDKSAILASIFYLYAPYHLIDLHFRVSIAEVLSYAFIPIAFLLTKKIISKPTILLVIFNGFIIGLFILTHQIISLMFFPILILYGIYSWIKKKRRSVKEFILFILSFFLGILLSAFYWIPVIVESRFTQTGSGSALVNFVPFQNLLYSPWRYGSLFQGPHGELAFIIGYTQILVLLLALYLLLKRKIHPKAKSLLFLFIALSLIAIFMITPASKNIWEILPLSKHFQYSYRLLLILCLSISVIAGIIVYKSKNLIFIIILGLVTIFYTILNWGNRGMIPEINDASLVLEYQRNPDVGDYLEPSSPIWVNINKPDLRKKPDFPIEIISGDASIKQISRKSIKHEYLINVSSDSLIRENTLYFPGWELLVDNKKEKIIYTNPDLPGIITFPLDKGLHKVVIEFKPTPIRKVSIFISTLSLVLIFSLIFREIFKKITKNV